MPYPTEQIPPGVTDADEIKTERTLTAKKWDKGGGETVMNAHGGPKHYFDQFDLDSTGQRFREIDTTLVALGGGQGWAMAEKYADYFVAVKSRSNQFSTFKNLEPAHRGTNEADYDEIGLRVAANVVGVKEGDFTINYPGAFTVGSNNVDLNLRFQANNATLNHEVEIPSRPLGIATEMPLEFELEIPTGYDIHINDVEWVNRSGVEQTTQVVRIGLQGTPRSEWIRLRRFFVWDSDDKQVPVNTTFEETSPGIVKMTKLIPRSFLIQAENNGSYPVFTDASITPFSTAAGDGPIEHSNATWSTVRNAATGTQARAANANIQTGAWTGYDIIRGFTSFDTSAIGTGQTVSAAVLSLYGFGATDNGGEAVLVESTQASPSALTTADYDAFNTTELAARFDIGSWNTGGYNDWTLTDYTTIDPVGDTMFCTLMSNDYDDSAPSADNVILYHASEKTGTANDPYLTVTYAPTPAGGGLFMPRSRQYLQLLHH